MDYVTSHNWHVNFRNTIATRYRDPIAINYFTGKLHHMTMLDLDLNDPSHARQFLLFLARQIGINWLDGEIDKWDDLKVVSLARKAEEMFIRSRQVH